MVHIHYILCIPSNPCTIYRTVQIQIKHTFTHSQSPLYKYDIPSTNGTVNPFTFAPPLHKYDLASSHSPFTFDIHSTNVTINRHFINTTWHRVTRHCESLHIRTAKALPWSRGYHCVLQVDSRRMLSYETEDCECV